MTQIPSEQVRIGIIGFGRRGTLLASVAQMLRRRLQVVAVADLYDGHLRRARELLGDQIDAVRDYRRVLDRGDVDALIVATPDHWHLPICLEALSAGKHVCCEAPVTHSVEQGPQLVQAVRRADRVFRSGSGWISSSRWQKVREIVSSGRLGTITTVVGNWDSNSSLEAWQRPFPPDASPESIDFERFSVPASGHPFDLKRFFRWPCYWDYGSGLAGARFVHQLTAVAWVMGAGTPAGATAAGALLRWKDGREVPDVFQTIFQYDEGFTLSLSSSLNNASRPRETRFMGTDATLIVDDRHLRVLSEVGEEPYRQAVEPWSAEYRDWFYMMHGLSPEGSVRQRPVEAARAEEVLSVAEGESVELLHLTQFLDSVALGDRSEEDVRDATVAATAVHMANQSFLKKRSVTWDEQAQTVGG